MGEVLMAREKAGASVLRLVLRASYCWLMYDIDDGDNYSGSGPPTKPPTRVMKISWTLALVVGFVSLMLGAHRLDAGIIFLVIGGLFTIAFYFDRRKHKRFEQSRAEYERQYGPHPSRRQDGLPLATWLETEPGKEWLKLPQAREFLATAYGEQFSKDFRSQN